MIHRKFGIHACGIQFGGFVDDYLESDSPPATTLTIVPASIESHGSTTILRCAQLSLASLILLTLESCSSPPRNRANGPASPSRVAIARAEASTQSLGNVPSAGRWAAAQARPRRLIAQASSSTAPISTQRPGQPDGGSRRIDRVGLVSGEWNGTFARIAVDLHNEVGADHLALELSASGGPLQTLDQIIHRPGVDVGLVQADALERLMQDDPTSDAREHLRYIAPLYDETVHVVASTDITNLRQLDGRRVNVGKAGSSSDITARLVFEKLGIKATFTNHEIKDALDHLGAGEIDAAVILAPSPAWEILVFQTE
jgi:ABC-type amino acid transport substrate-binding protein